MILSIIIVVLFLVLFGRVGVFILVVFVLCVIAFHKVYVAMLWRLCIFSKFCQRACTDVSHVAGERVELTVHKESLVVDRGNKGSGTEISSCANYLWQKL